MGLDVKALSNLTEVKEPELDYEGEVVNTDKEWKPGELMNISEKYFPGRAKGLNAETVYKWEDDYHFSVGSCTSYNLWRARLASVAVGDDFQELIKFRDDEGVIGPEVAKKLSEDFNRNRKAVEAFSKTFGIEGEMWFEAYTEWQNVFEIAANNGAVVFN